MTLGQQMLPQSGGPGMGTPPQTPEEFQGLHGQWMNFLARPETQAALLQFAASVVQPVGRGQSTVGNIGLAVADAGAAAGRVREQRFKEAGQVAEMQNRERLTGVQERQAAADEARVGVAGRQLDQDAAQFKDKMALEFEKLGIEKSRAAAYAGYVSQLGGAAAMRIPGYAEAIRAATSDIGLQFDPGTPEYDQAFASAVAAVNRAFQLAQGVQATQPFNNIPATPQTTAPGGTMQVGPGVQPGGTLGGAGQSADNPVGVTTLDEAMKLPSGTFYKRPDGVVMQR